MSVYNDLIPKPTKLTVKGVEVECLPLKLSHVLIVSKLGEAFENPKNLTADEIRRAEAEMDSVISELIPELKGISLDASATIELLTQMVATVQPADNKELTEKGVSFNNDPKA